VELAQPQDYDERYAKWRFEDLPILPEAWQTVVSESTSEQYRILEGLLHRDDVGDVVNACDAGREGEAIFRMVYEKAGCDKPMLRLWISSMEDAAIRDGFESLRPGSEYDRLFLSAGCRSKADWLVGINGTRLFTTQYGRKLTVGRVQTPTLAMLTERRAQIEGFQKESFYKAHISSGGYRLTAEENMDKAQADQVAEKCRGKDAVVTVAESVEKTAKPPKLYDLTTLQREANRCFGYTAKQTLDYTQKLYEAKLVTYPRTDSRYLTEDMEETVLDLMQDLPEILPFRVDVPFIPDAHSMIDNKKVTDHHAIIPTKASLTADFSALSKGERSVFFLIAQRLLVAGAEPMVFLESVVKAECEGTEFSVKGKTVLQKGWTVVEDSFQTYAVDKKKKKNEADDEETVPQGAQAGLILSKVDADVTEHFTRPPKPYTEDTLLSAMERAGSGEFAKETEKKGLGTPATRAGIIEKLVNTGYVVRNGRQLTATDDAMKLIEILPETVKSPGMTAEWENQLLKMEQGEVSADEFMQNITQLVTSLVEDYADVGTDARKIFSGVSDADSIGICPRCGAKIVERKQSYSCCNRKCDFALWKENRYMQSIGLDFTRKVAESMLKKGYYLAKGLESKRTGKKYDAKIRLVENGGKYPGFEMEFVNRKKRGKER
ncbi:MAG: DNA topoisomerase III, partial [Lachnospiraceae bacterium]|nr:DNA topoisomerase III [Lachnospiraceae bacterium]